MKIDLMAVNDDGQATLILAAEFDREIRALARSFRDIHRGAKITNARLELRPNSHLRLALQMERRDGISEVIYSRIF